jgi:hypothetical protein
LAWYERSSQPSWARNIEQARISIRLRPRLWPQRRYIKQFAIVACIWDCSIEIENTDASQFWCTQTSVGIYLMEAFLGRRRPGWPVNMSMVVDRSFNMIFPFSESVRLLNSLSFRVVSVVPPFQCLNPLLITRSSSPCFISSFLTLL